MTSVERKLRIGILIDRWQPQRGGAERALADLAQWLEQRGHTVLAFAAHGPRAGEEAPGSFQRVRAARPWAMRAAHAWNWSRAARERRLSAALVAAARAAECDVTIGIRHLPSVDLYWPHAGAHGAALSAARAARDWARSWARDGYDAPSQPVACAPAAPHGRHRAFVELERALIGGGGARLIVCVSELVRAEFAALYPDASARMRVVHNGIDRERFHPRERERAGASLRAQLGVPAHVPLLTFGGRNPLLKGLPTLLAALAALQHLEWQLLIAGPRAEQRWLRRARRAGIARERLHVRRDVDPVALASASDLCVLPSWRDPFPLVVLEALSSGTPVITTARVGAASLITRPEFGSVLERAGDAQLLRAALEQWLQRLRTAPIDRMLVREAVAGCAHEARLAELEGLLVELARTR